jgi:hypothetical protein
MKFKVGDRVMVYQRDLFSYPFCADDMIMTCDECKGIIRNIDKNNFSLEIELIHPYMRDLRWFHEKQCRLLVKKGTGK